MYSHVKLYGSKYVKICHLFFTIVKLGSVTWLSVMNKKDNFCVFLYKIMWKQTCEVCCPESKHIL